MIKTIKVKKELTFRELMEYIFENNIHAERFSSVSRQDMEDKYISVSPMGMLDFSNNGYNIGELYEVEVEQEISEDTEFELVLINTASHLTMRHDYSIKHAKHTFNNIQEIFARIDGRVEKIWEKDGKI